MGLAPRRSHLPGPSWVKEARDTWGRGVEGAAPRAEPLRGKRATLQEAAGLVKKTKPRRPGAAAGILAVPAETFPEK